jgi:hypothetical protein
VSQVTLARNRSLHFLDNHSGHDCGHSATRVLHLEPVGRAAGAIRRVLPPRAGPETLTILAGRPKLGKSWLMLDVGLAVAAGRYCLGETKCEQGDVLYLALEDNERRLQSRITKILGYADDWPARFYYATEWPRADAGGLDEIRKWLASAEKPRLVVVDILAMFRTPHRLP